MRTATSIDEVAQIYTEWVEGEGAEGLVVHNYTRIISKVKPRHSIDAVCVGYTSSDRGVRDLMFAVRRDDGKYQVFACGSRGMSDEERMTLAERLATKHIESQYVIRLARHRLSDGYPRDCVRDMRARACGIVQRGQDKYKYPY